MHLHWGMGDDEEPEAWIRSFVPWNSRHRKYSGILTQDQRKALLAPGKLEGDSGREMRKRIRRRVRHALYDFVLLNRHMRNKDKLQIFAREDLTNAFSTSIPTDNTVISNYFNDLDEPNPAVSTCSLYASDSMERFLYDVLESLDRGMNGGKADNPRQSHPLIDAGITENYAEARKLEMVAHQAMILNSIIASPEDDIGVEYLHFLNSLPAKATEALEYYNCDNLTEPWRSVDDEEN